MTTSPIVNLVSFIISVILQAIMAMVLPSTKEYTSLWPTLTVIACINVAIWLLARIVASGVQLSLLVPITAAAVPLAVIVGSIVIYHEPAPALKVVLLVFASLLIGVASSLK